MTATKDAQGERVAWVEPTKGLAMLMVIAFHATLYLQAADVDAVLGRAKAVFELFPMPAFFLLAGVFAARQASFAFRLLWRRRLLSLLYLYVLWSVIRTVFYLVVPGLNGELGEIPATDPLALPLILVWPSSSYWFLYALFLFTLGRWLIAKLPPWVQLAGSGMVSTLFTSGLVQTGNIGWDRVGGLFFFFVLGAVASQQIRSFVDRARLVHLAVAVAVVVVVTGLIVLGLRGVPFVVMTGQLASVVVGSLLCARLVRLRPFGFLTTVGNSSLKLYLLHLYLIVPATALVELLDPAWSRPVDIAVQAGLIVVSVAGSFVLARLTSGIRWLYVPPAFLRGPGRGEAERGRARLRDPGPDTRESSARRTLDDAATPSTAPSVLDSTPSERS